MSSVHHSLRASSISSWVFPAAWALLIIVFDRSSGLSYSSPGWAWTPNLAAKRFTYLYYWLMPILWIVPAMLVSAPISGIIWASWFLYSAAALAFWISASIYAWAAFILALTSSTVSMWPSSTGSGSGYGYESCWAAIKFLMAILLSTSAIP